MVSDVAEHIRLKEQMALVWDASKVCIEIGTACGIFQLCALLRVKRLVPKMFWEHK